MKKQGLREMVKSIFGDESVRSEFARDPESVISKYTLTSVEKKTILSPSLKMALVSGDSKILADGVLETWF